MRTIEDLEQKIKTLNGELTRLGSAIKEMSDGHAQMSGMIKELKKAVDEDLPIGLIMEAYKNDKVFKGMAVLLLHPQGEHVASFEDNAAYLYFLLTSFLDEKNYYQEIPVELIRMEPAIRAVASDLKPYAVKLAESPEKADVRRGGVEEGNRGSVDTQHL
jgi:hypothetical protein